MQKDATNQARLMRAVASLMAALGTLSSSAAQRATGLLLPFSIRGLDDNYVDQLSACLSMGIDELHWSPAEMATLTPHLQDIERCIAGMASQPFSASPRS